jgi:DNA repair protein RadC
VIYNFNYLKSTDTPKARPLMVRDPSTEDNPTAKPKRKASGIAKWPEDERPRERLLSRGPHALTDAELLAILLRVGVQGKSAVELGRELIKRFGSVQSMMSAPLSAWDGIKGLGKAKQAQLLAALELGRRAALPTVREHTIIKSTRQTADYFITRLRGLPDEHFRVAYLNRLGRLLDDALIAEGTVDTVRPPIRAIVARALQTNASALIAAHNHPSGAAEPSEADKTLTRDLIAACHPLGLQVLEHVIVTDTNHFSFADTGLLDELALETLAPSRAKR